MTIKQQGGIFGRNPSFNDVDVNKLDVDGVVIDPSSSAYFYAVNDDPANKYMFDFRTSEGGGFRLGATAGANPTHWVQTFFDEPLEIRIGGSSPTFTFEKTGNATIEDGNLIIGTSGHGIDFSATSGTGTSELFDDYEEGTWTPVMSENGAGVNNWTASTATGYYTKIGRQVNLQCVYTYTATAGNPAFFAFMIGLPFVPASDSGRFSVQIQSGSGAITDAFAGVAGTGGSISFIKNQNISSPGAMLGGDFPAATATITFQASYLT